MPPQFQTVLQHAADLRSQGEKSLGEIRGAVTGQLRALQMEVNSLRSEVSKAVCHLAGDLQQRHHDLQQRSLHMNPSSVHAFAVAAANKLSALFLRSLSSERAPATWNIPHNFLLWYLQSLSLCSPGITGKAPQPVAELAMHPGEVAARLRGVTVYTVVNKKNEFVLVSGEVSSTAATALPLPPDTCMLPVVYVDSPQT